MGLLDIIFRKDPTRDWPAGGAAPLRYDLVRRELNGIGFDAPFDALRGFGKPENENPVRAHSFIYAPLGLTVAIDSRSRIDYFCCVFQADADSEMDECPGFAPCRITLENERGTLLDVTSATTLATVRDALGSLLREEPDHGGIFAATVGRVWLGFTFAIDGRLMLLDIEPAANVTDPSA